MDGLLELVVLPGHKIKGAQDKVDLHYPSSNSLTGPKSSHAAVSRQQVANQTHAPPFTVQEIIIDNTNNKRCIIPAPVAPLPRHVGIHGKS